MKGECGETLQDLGDGIDRPSRAPIATRYGDETIQERVLCMPGLKAGRRPEVVSGGIDYLTAGQCRDHVRRPVTKPEGRHVDQRAIVGLQRDPQIEFQNAVASEERPVTA